MTDVKTLAGQLTALTGEQLHDLIEALGDTGRDRLTEALRDVKSAANDSLIVLSVRAGLAAAGVDNVLWVVFTAEELDNGYYLSEHAIAYCAGGTSHRINFNIGDAFTDQFGAVGASFAYAVNPNTGESVFDDYAIEVYGFTGLDSTHGVHG
jgi:hypothetical protein